MDAPAPPDRVFAAARRAGVGPALDALVIRRALGLRDQLPPNCFLSINVDPTHVASPEVAAASRPPWPREGGAAEQN